MGSEAIPSRFHSESMNSWKVEGAKEVKLVVTDRHDQERLLITSALLVPFLFGRSVLFKAVIEGMGKEVMEFVWSYFKLHNNTKYLMVLKNAKWEE